LNPIPPEEVSKRESRNNFLKFRVGTGDVFVAEAIAPVETTPSLKMHRVIKLIYIYI
jgi:hypothetical protein